jgi:hypothetical protein
VEGTRLETPACLLWRHEAKIFQPGEIATDILEDF